MSTPLDPSSAQVFAEPASLPRKPRSTVFILLVVLGCVGLLGLIVIGVLAGIGFQAFQRAQEANRIVATLSRLKDIDSALFLYGQEHNDQLPYKDEAGKEFKTSNEAFRELFKAGCLGADAERFFESPVNPGGPAKADQRIGNEPDFAAALAPGECHWAMVKNGSMIANGPLVWENSLSGGWNPTWDPTLERTKPGSTWSNDRVIILTAGHAVKSYKLENKNAPSKVESLGGGNVFSREGHKEALDPSGL